MSAATELMSKYAAYHRDRRNIATHFVGIPLIVFAVGGLLAKPGARRPFVRGCALQFVGHYYEGKKPAFVDDIRGLLVGPMFVVGEALFALGWGKSLLAEIEA